ncbi:disease resistance protein RGA2-like [Phragmites australis]|uniref:disease resistance protein RGA2-like n=1 Tax=Phragmites australis TaxID=29695 RepID=UPI002D782E19|nr:disease resistance protein RGA2-like [Phragmites australis]
MCEAGDDVREAIKMEKLDVFADLGHRNFSVHPRGQTTAYFTEPKVFGRDTVKGRIVGMLTSKETCGVNLSVLPIVGNGGVGKTTLAQLLYNDAIMQDHFSRRIWISVSVDFDEVRLTREMLDCLSNGVSKHDEITNLNKLQEILEESIKSKRLLLVLDDMWEDNDKSRWDKLLAPLRCSSLKGSAILVTTRNHSVVKMIATMDPIHLDGLEDDDFWVLFKSCVFGDEKYEGHRNLQIIGQGIAKKLKGYPLAAKSVGALLKRNLDGGHWMGILQSDEWKLQQGPDDIIPALKLSYVHLPFHLQRCFSYCALFPKGHRFDALDLVRIWISQGMVSSGNGRMEETGRQYLNDLVDRGFFQRSAYYSMHDLMHDLAQIVSSGECHMVDSFDSRNGTCYPTIQHLSINTRFAYKWNTDARNFFPNDNFQRKLVYIGEAVQTRNLSTLMLFGKYDAGFSETFSHVFKEVQHLRVLRLPTLTYSIDFLLRNFSKLIHLRYLELISSGPGEPLPEVICQLYHLQVLDVEYWVHLPTLPRGMNNLVNLRHFVARGELHAMIAGVGRLKFLQELKVFRVGKTTDFEIGQLNGLRELGGSLAIYNLENVGSKEESHNAGLRDKRYRQDLLLSWSNNRFAVRSLIETEVLEGLHPHSSLKHLHITGYGGEVSIQNIH